MKLKRPSVSNGEVIRIPKKGMFNPSASEPYGDIYVRIHVELPTATGGSLEVKKGPNDPKARLHPEDEIDLDKLKETDLVFRHYTEAGEATLATAKAPRGEIRRDEL